MLGYLYLYRYGRLDADATALADDARASGHARPELADDGEDGGRIYVDPAHYEHVISAAETAHAKARPAAGARRALDPYDVATQKADHRHRLACEGRVDHLADGAVSKQVLPVSEPSNAGHPSAPGLSKEQWAALDVTIGKEWLLYISLATEEAIRKDDSGQLLFLPFPYLSPTAPGSVY